MKTELERLLLGRRPLDIASLPFPAGLRLLLLGPHPDDFDAIGVTLRFFHDRGHRIDVAVVRSGSGVEDGYCTPPTLAVKAALREEEQRRSCRFFGLPEERLTFLDLEQDDRAQPLESQANLRSLQELIQATGPDVVFMPHGRDTNTGHQRMARMFHRVASAASFPLAAFLNRDPKTIRLRVDLYLAFGEEQARWKARLLRFHDSQHQRNLNTRGHGLDDRILAVNRAAAQELPVEAPYAEVFEVALYGGSQAAGAAGA